MYGVLWSVGLLSISLVSLRNSLRKQQTKKNELKMNEKSKTTPEELSHSQKKKEDLNLDNDKLRASTLLSRYVDELIPQVFHQQSYFKRMWDEILQNHRYITLFYTREVQDENENENESDGGGESDYKRILTSVHVLTVQTMLMFMLAVFYDLQVSNSFIHSSFHFFISS